MIFTATISCVAPFLLECVSQSHALYATSGASPFVHSAKGSLSDEFQELIVRHGSVCSCCAVHDYLVHVFGILNLLMLCASADRSEWIQMIGVHVWIDPRCTVLRRPGVFSCKGQTVRYCRKSAGDALLAHCQFVLVLPVKALC